MADHANKTAIHQPALLGGWRNSNGDFNNQEVNGNYWSATEQSADNAWNYNFNSNNGKLNRNNNNKSRGFSCRCVQDSRNGRLSGLLFLIQKNEVFKINRSG